MKKGTFPSSMSSGKNQSPDGFFGWNLGTRHQRSVRKRVSPNRSWNSCSSLCPPRGARWAISPEWGNQVCKEAFRPFPSQVALQDLLVNRPQLFDSRWFPVSPLDQFEVCDRGRDEAVQPSFPVYNLPSELPLHLDKSSSICW